MKARSNTRTTVYIFFEGQTEQFYFQRLSEIVNNDPNLWVVVDAHEIQDGDSQDPIGLVSDALDKLDEGYDEAWVVFDRDRDPNDNKYRTAFSNANGKVGIAFSSIAFEHWVLLHYEKSEFPFTRSDCESRGGSCVCNGTTCLLTYIKANHYPGYKKASRKLFDEINPRFAKAAINCAWLRYSQVDNLRSVNGEVFRINPYTTVDILAARLKGEPKILFAKPGDEIVLGGLTYVSSDIVLNGNSLTATFDITNHTKANHLLSHGFSSFYVMDEALNCVRCNEHANFYMAPRETLSHTFLFNFQQGFNPLYLSKNDGERRLVMQIQCD